MMAVRKMSAMREVQAEDRVTRLQYCGVSFHVRLRSRVWLNVSVLSAKELLGAVARQVLDHIGKLTAAIVALAGISLGVLVREHRARSFEHGFADKVLGSDQFEAFVLAASLAINSGGDLRIVFVQRKIHPG